MGCIGRWWSLKGEAGCGVVKLPVDGLWGCSPGLEIELLLRWTGRDGSFSLELGIGTSSSSAGPSFLFPKVVTSLVVRTGESSVPTETPGLDDWVGEPRGGVSILGGMGEGAWVWEILSNKEVRGVCTGNKSQAASTGVDIAWGAVGGLKAFSNTGGVSTWIISNKANG